MPKLQTCACCLLLVVFPMLLKAPDPAPCQLAPALSAATMQSPARPLPHYYTAASIGALAGCSGKKSKLEIKDVHAAMQRWPRRLHAARACNMHIRVLYVLTFVSYQQYQCAQPTGVLLLHWLNCHTLDRNGWSQLPRGHSKTAPLSKARSKDTCSSAPAPQYPPTFIHRER